MGAAKNKYYVYHLIDPINNVVFYVGKGTGNRHKTHESKVIRNPLQNCKSEKDKKILSIVNSGYSVKSEIITNNLTEIEALILEENEIEAIGIKNLTNKYKKGGKSGDTSGYVSAGRMLSTYWLSLKDVRCSEIVGEKFGVSLKSIHSELDEIMKSALSCPKMKTSFITGIGIGIEQSKHSLSSVI